MARDPALTAWMNGRDYFRENHEYSVSEDVLSYRRVIAGIRYFSYVTNKHHYIFRTGIVNEVPRLRALFKKRNYSETDDLPELIKALKLLFDTERTFGYSSLNAGSAKRRLISRCNAALKEVRAAPRFIQASYVVPKGWKVDEILDEVIASVFFRRTITHRYLVFTRNNADTAAAQKTACLKRVSINFTKKPAWGNTSPPAYSIFETDDNFSVTMFQLTARTAGVSEPRAQVAQMLAQLASEA